MCCHPPSQGPKATCPCAVWHTWSLERRMSCRCEDGRGAARAGKAQSCPLPVLPAARAELGTPRQAGSCSPESRIPHLAGPGALSPEAFRWGAKAGSHRGGDGEGKDQARCELSVLELLWQQERRTQGLGTAVAAFLRTGLSFPGDLKPW